MKQQHHPIDVKTYEKGINSDTNKELLGLRNGEHVDSLNMRSLSMDGDNSAKKKIKGEKLLYRNIDNRCIGATGLPLSDTYVCVMTMDVQGFIVEAWASTQPSQNPPLMRVNGKIVLMSHDFPIDVNHPLQYHKNEVAVGCEIYITNHNTPPMVFSLKDLLNKSGVAYDPEDDTEELICDLTYFSEFNINEYTVNIQSNLTKVRFVQQDVSTTLYPYNLILGALGVPVGYHSYSYRFVSEAGDRGRWSPMTELIPVLKHLGAGDQYFPNRRNYADYPNSASASGYGNHLKMRLENFNNFKAIELRRDSWFNGEGIGSPPTSAIIALIDISPYGEGVYVLDVLDRVHNTEIEEVLTLDDTATETLTSIQSAKSIRYYNDKLYLMNIEYASKAVDNDIEFVKEDGNCFPTIEEIGKAGHKDPYNATYFKSNMRGDVSGFGVVLFDGDGNTSYVKKITGGENFPFPNRRDPVSIETEGTSYRGLSYGGRTNGTIGANHDVFRHHQAISKQGFLKCWIGRKPNVLQIENWWNDWTYRAIHPVSMFDNSSNYPDNPNPYCFITTEECTLYDGNITPFHSYAGAHDYAPKGFGLNYYSMGIGFSGIKNKPGWASGFSVVQTASANRVVAQGLGWYAMIKVPIITNNPTHPDASLKSNGRKHANKLWCYFPDFDDEIGGINSGLLDEVLQNPEGFKIQLTAPLGFFTECYSFFRTIDRNLAAGSTFTVNRFSIAADLITYCRVIHDNGEINYGGCNGFESAGVKYVGYGANRSNNPPAVFPSNSNGNHLFSMAVPPTEIVTPTGRQKYLEITLTESCYSTSQTYNKLDSTQTEVRNFQEPMYVVNIVRANAAIIDGNTTQYNYTGHYIKFESLIGMGTDDNLTLPLVSERWEDCVIKLPGQTPTNNYYSNLERFIFIEEANTGVKKRWLNVTYKSSTTINSILATLQSDGFYDITDWSGTYKIYGVYKDTTFNLGTHQEVRLVFNSFANYPKNFMIPQKGDKIYVHYDYRIPVRVFGGDTWINDNVWAPVDTEWTGKDYPKPVDPSHRFGWNIAMPLNGYLFDKAYMILRNAKEKGGMWTGYVQQGRSFAFHTNDKPAWIRQWVAMWTAETRTNLSFFFGDPSDSSSMDSSFPLRNYTPRPYEYSTDKFGTEDVVQIKDDNFLSGDYINDYGDEWKYWQYGGFRFKPQTNIDYSKKNTTLLLTTAPKIGFKEQTKYPTRVLWSETRPINAQFTPTVRSFPPANFYDLSDGTGEIKFAWDGNSGDKGNNLYAFTNKGVALLLVDKRTINEINANELATVGSDVRGVLNHLFIDRSIGMRDETWRSWAEYSNGVFWHNGTACYMLANNEIINLSDNGWQEMYRLRIAPHIGAGYSTHLAGVFNNLNKEYIMNLDHKLVRPTDRDIVPISVIYGVGQEALQCRSTYNYDKYLNIENKLYGFKDLVTFELGVGNTINGEPIESNLVGVSDKEIFFDKEFIRIRVNSNSKPEKIVFYSSYKDYLDGNKSSSVDASSSLVAIKDYFGYECYIPRKNVSLLREQGRYLIFKIISSQDEDFVISSTGVQYKTLK